MPLQVGDKVAYRKEMTRVVGTIAAMEGDLVINVTGMTKAEVGHTCDLWGYRPTGAATLPNPSMEQTRRRGVSSAWPQGELSLQPPPPP